MWKIPSWGWSSTRGKTEISSRRTRRNLYVPNVFSHTCRMLSLTVIHWYYTVLKVVKWVLLPTSLFSVFPLLRHESRRSWRSCCCLSSRAMSSGDWRCCRRRRGSYRPRGRISRLCWMNWWVSHVLLVCLYPHISRAVTLWLTFHVRSHTHTNTHTHTHTHTLSLRVHGYEIIKSLLLVIVLQAALFSFCDSKASWLHCVELWALEVIVPAEQAAEGPSQIAD